ncbi:MAG TPA: ATP-binding protein, partial [Chthoniobacteraceae bacterium]
DLTTRIQQLGRQSYAATPSPLLAKTVHDVRGGGLSALLSRMQLVGLGLIDLDALNALYFLTRDHLKIMRNALLGLDDLKRAEDLLPKIHGTDFIVQKWNGANLGGRDRQLRLEVECPQPVAISECCVEFGALDRILYNLINNACRHTTGDVLRLVLFPVPTPEGENLRFVLLNPIGPGDAERLGSGDLGNLFETGVSTTGSGYGLSVAADFVANAFGLATPAAAVEGGYLGARLLPPDFAVWFHWPIVAEY